MTKYNNGCKDETKVLKRVYIKSIIILKRMKIL